jgi:hypothetical protein
MSLNLEDGRNNQLPYDKHGLGKAGELCRQLFYTDKYFFNDPSKNATWKTKREGMLMLLNYGGAGGLSPGQEPFELPEELPQRTKAKLLTPPNNKA